MSYSAEEIKDKLKGYIDECHDVSLSCNNLDFNELHLEDDCYMDSIDLVEFVMWIEQEFDIEIDDEEAGKWEKMGNVLNFLREAL